MQPGTPEEITETPYMSRTLPAVLPDHAGMGAVPGNRA
jgi:hypothetical protein